MGVIFSFVHAPSTVLLPTWTSVCVEVCVCVRIVGEPPIHVLSATPAILCGPADMLACVHLIGLPVILPLILCVVFAVCLLAFSSVCVYP